MCVRNAATLFLAATISLIAFVRAEAQTPAWAKVSREQVAAAKKLGVPVAFENSARMRFVLIPAGTFTMGSGDSAAEVAASCAMPNAQAGWFYDEHPSHKVTLTTAFYMAVHEVTQGCYQAVMNPDPAKDADKNKANEYPEEFQGKNNPIGKVSFSDANKFCKALTSSDKRQYVLPTEAQWEYACRAGTQTPFSFGKTISTNQANYNGNYTYGDGVKGVHREKPVPGGSLPANPWGLHEMHGNVSEWCADQYGPYGADAQTDPTGPAEKGGVQVLRGGSWRSYPGACRCAFRIGSAPNSTSYNVGFRVCCAIPTEPDESESK